MSDRKDTCRNSNVIATADDAILSKLYAHKKGYLNDPFVQHFATNATGLTTSTTSSQTQAQLQLRSTGIQPQFGRTLQFDRTLQNQHSGEPQRIGGQPLIRRGTFARVCCIDKAINVFMSSSPRGQVVVMGAGKDTNYFRYKTGLLQQQPKPTSSVKWYDVDFDSVMETKRQLIGKLPQNCSPPSQATQDDKYYLVGYDLSQPPNQLFDILENKYEFDPNEQTLFVFECVLMYLTKHNVQELLSFISKTCRLAVVVIYDPLILEDSFGQVMLQHLIRARLIKQEQSSLLATRTLDSMITMLRQQCGFDIAIGANMVDAYDTILSHAQRMHANHCEMLDELEEWHLLMSHYCLVVATKFNGASDITPQEEQLVSNFTFVKLNQSTPFILKTPQSQSGHNDNIQPCMGFIRGKCSLPVVG